MSEVGDATESAGQPGGAAPPRSLLDLSKLARHRDLLLVVGFLMVVGGVATCTVAGAVVLAGLGVMYASYLMSL